MSREIEKEIELAGRLEIGPLRLRYEKLLPANINQEFTFLERRPSGRRPRLIKLSSDEVRKAVVNGTISNFCSEGHGPLPALPFAEKATRYDGLRRPCFSLIANRTLEILIPSSPRRKSYPSP